MVFHIGNNVYLGRSLEGDTTDDVSAVQNAVFIDIDSGIIYHYFNNAWGAASFGTKEDKLIVPILRQMPMNNIGTTYADIFPAFYDNFPIPFSTVGYKNFGIVLL